MLSRLRFLAKQEKFRFQLFVKGELEMKKGSDGKKSLFYLDKAVQLNDYDEAALVARSR